MATEVRVVWNGETVILGTRRQAMVAFERAGGWLLDKANETVPVDTGVLKDSAKVGLKTSGGAVTAVKISYPDQPVALIQHEDTEYHHTGTGRAKWLFLAIQENRDEALKMIEEDLRAFFGMG